MDDDSRQWLFDPTTAHRLVLAHRPAAGSAVSCVVSDVVWQEVVGLLRWATAGTGGDADLESKRWWHLAASCAELLRRLPALSDELGEQWRPSGAPPEADSVDHAAARLTALLRSPGPLPLPRLAEEIDALGAAAIGALAARSSWVLP
jgi:hypothetical protein